MKVGLLIVLLFYAVNFVKCRPNECEPKSPTVIKEENDHEHNAHREHEQKANTEHEDGGFHSKNDHHGGKGHNGKTLSSL